MTRIVGINRTSNASISVVSEHGLELFLRKERITRKKHAWGQLGDMDLYHTFAPDAFKNIDGIVHCFSSDPQRRNASVYEAEARYEFGLSNDVMYQEISHHFAHAYSAFMTSPFKDAAILVVDNRGSRSGLIGQSARIVDGEDYGPLEVISAYIGDGQRIRRIDNQLWDDCTSKQAGLGVFYSTISELLFGHEHTEGILMGLAAYGNPDALSLPPLAVNGFCVSVPVEWDELKNSSAKFSFLKTGEGRFSDCADLAAATQFAFENALIVIANRLASETGMSQLVYAGGCALNCAANSRLLKETKFSELFILPACDDGGTSIGCALFGLGELDIPSMRLPWTSDYIGPQPVSLITQLPQAAAKQGLLAKRDPNLSRTVSKWLAQGEVIGLYQGGSEGGARALGNRSILADPRYDVMRSYINKEIKKRSWFRPLAPVVISEHATTYFELEYASPFMQSKCNVRAEYRKELAAVCHIDGSSRVQTVDASQNAFLYELLESFQDETGLPILLNTSFNGKSEPIIETLDDAISCFIECGLDRLIVPPFYITRPTAKRSALSF